jgi:hypothetical protein
MHNMTVSLPYRNNKIATANTEICGKMTWLARMLPICCAMHKNDKLVKIEAACAHRAGRPESDMRLRILAGMVALILGLAVYAVVVAVIALRFLPEQLAVDMAFYAAAGIIWIWPAARLTRWMSQAPPHHPPSGAST